MDLGVSCTITALFLTLSLRLVHQAIRRHQGPRNSGQPVDQ
jgi:hypothetical protein